GGLVRAARVADRALQTAYDLDVVGPDMRGGVYRGVDVIEVAAEVAEERLDEDVGTELAQARHGAGHVRRAAIQEAIAADHREHDVLQAEARDGARDVLGLATVHRASRIAARHGAEATPARADVAEQHDGRGALGPALAHVRAARLLADGVKVEL